MRAGTRLARPEWAVQIERLRERLLIGTRVALAVRARLGAVRR